MKISEVRPFNLYFAKTHENAVIPTKNTEDAGYDIYPLLNNDDNYFVLPGQILKLPTGIACALHKSKCLILKERSSTGLKGIGVTGGVIDSGYRGAFSVPIVNNSDKILVIASQNYIDNILSKTPDANNIFMFHPKEKAIAQALVVEVPVMETIEIDYETLKNIPSKRGLGDFGSSGK